MAIELIISESAYKIIELIEINGIISASEISAELDISIRTIHYTLKRLLESNYITKTAYLNDKRRTRYTLNNDVIQEIKLRN